MAKRVDLTYMLSPIPRGIIMLVTVLSILMH